MFTRQPTPIDSQQPHANQPEEIGKINTSSIIPLLSKQSRTSQRSILQLQSAYGNQAVLQLMRTGNAKGSGKKRQLDEKKESDSIQIEENASRVKKKVKPNNPVEDQDIEKLESIEGMDDSEEDVVKTTTGNLQTVGMSGAEDEEKIHYDEFIQKIVQLDEYVHVLINGGLDKEDLQSSLEIASELRTYILTTLNGSSKLKDAKNYRNYQGVYGIIDDYNPMLLKASLVLMQAEEKLKDMEEGDVSQPLDEPDDKEMSEKASAGQSIIKIWKKHHAYANIREGAKWKSAKLKDELAAYRRKTLIKMKALRAYDDLVETYSSFTWMDYKVVEPYLEQELGIPNPRSRGFNIDTKEKWEEYELLLQDALSKVSDDPDDIAEQLDKYAGEKHYLYPNDPYFTHPKKKDKDKANPIKLLSERNIHKLHEQLIDNAQMHFETNPEELETYFNRGVGCLMADEKELFLAVYGLPFTVKHATPNFHPIANDGSLDSFAEYSKKNPNWKSEFSTPGNVKKLGNHGFVFFRVDVGDEKIETRYGGTQISSDMSLIEYDGWVSMFDQLKPLSSNTMISYYDHKGALIRQAEIPSKGNTNQYKQNYKYGYIPQTGKKPKATFSKTNLKAKGSERYEDVDRETNFMDYVFYGPEIREGIALSLIHELRYFERSSYRDHLLEAFRNKKGEERVHFLKKLIGKLFRPEGKYPVALRFNEHPISDMRVLNPDGDKRWNPDGTANSPIMQQIKIIQRKKFLDEAMPLARKNTAAYAEHINNNKNKLEEAEKTKVKSDKVKRDIEIYRSRVSDYEQKWKIKHALWKQYEKDLKEVNEQMEQLKKSGSPYVAADKRFVHVTGAMDQELKLEDEFLFESEQVPEEKEVAMDLEIQPPVRVEGTRNQFKRVAESSACSAHSLMAITAILKEGRMLSTEEIDQVLNSGAELYKETIRGSEGKLHKGSYLNPYEAHHVQIRDQIEIAFLENRTLKATEFATFFENILSNSDAPKIGYAIVIGSYTIAVVKINQSYIVFDSHGYGNIGNAFNVSFADQKNLLAFLNRMVTKRTRGDISISAFQYVGE
ncbi:hypothetical protein ACFVS2_31470 [Brevibacillus sp. NPDC058079]|uniref:hypothetical protein n=1 Tax=Brevibacillus sp. NPDC058079 TaxID=3346330 RepID=UPI0036EAA461